MLSDALFLLECSPYGLVLVGSPLCGWYGRGERGLDAGLELGLGVQSEEARLPGAWRQVPNVAWVENDFEQSIAATVARIVPSPLTCVLHPPPGPGLGVVHSDGLLLPLSSSSSLSSYT